MWVDIGLCMRYHEFVLFIGYMHIYICIYIYIYICIDSIYMRYHEYVATGWSACSVPWPIGLLRAMGQASAYACACGCRRMLRSATIGWFAILGVHSGGRMGKSFIHQEL